MKRDILEILHIDKKEDYYTFILLKFLENPSFRAASAEWWGFEKNEDDYEFKRTEIKQGKRRMVPDIRLYNNKHIAVIESKMFSQEGYKQTQKYKNAEAEIKAVVAREKGVKETNLNVEYYFFTLSGVKAETSDFKTIRWAEYYSDVLKKACFTNAEEIMLANAMKNRADSFIALEKNFRNMDYHELVNNANSWIEPSSVFSGGYLDSIWGLKIGSDLEDYYVYSADVTGQGHVTHRTDIGKHKYWVVNKSGITDDNIAVFTRIEWGDKVCVFLNWEYWKCETEGNSVRWIDYVNYSSKKQEHQSIAYENRKEWLNKVNTPEGIQKCPLKEDMLHMVKKTIQAKGKTIGEVVDEVRRCIPLFDDLAESITKRLYIQENGYYYWK